MAELTGEQAQALLLLARGLAHQINPRLACAKASLKDANRASQEAGALNIQKHVVDALLNLEEVEELIDVFWASPNDYIAGANILNLADLLTAAIKTACRQRDFLRGDAAGFQINVVDDAPQDKLVIRGSQVWLTEALLIVLKNAFEAMASSKQKVLSVIFGYGISEEPEPMTQIDIRDTGCGIAPRHSKKIFEPFFTTKPGRGTGIGLYFAKSIIEAHGGFVICKSKLGKGTTISIHLPLYQKEG